VTLPTLNKSIRVMKCTVHYVVHLQCTFSLSLSLSLSRTYESKGFWLFSVGTGTKEDESSTWRVPKHANYLTSPCYGPFSFGARFETYEPFTPLILPFFGEARGKPRILNHRIWGHDCLSNSTFEQQAKIIFRINVI
jgi:hypothetical protein